MSVLWWAFIQDKLGYVQVVTICRYSQLTAQFASGKNACPLEWACLLMWWQESEWVHNMFNKDPKKVGIKYLPSHNICRCRHNEGTSSKIWNGHATLFRLHVHLPLQGHGLQKIFCFLNKQCEINTMGIWILNIPKPDFLASNIQMVKNGPFGMPSCFYGVLADNSTLINRKFLTLGNTGLETCVQYSDDICPEMRL